MAPPDHSSRGKVEKRPRGAAAAAAGEQKKAGGGGGGSASRSSSGGPPTKRPRGDAPAAATKGEPRKYDPKLRKGKKGPTILTKEQRKELVKHRKASRPHADVLADLGQLWSMPLATMEKAARASATERILSASRGKLMEVAHRHDASRAFQAIIKYGSHAQREEIFSELSGNLADLAVDRYGHHIVLKLLQYSAADLKKKVMAEFLATPASFSKVALHLDGAKVLDYGYASGTNADRLAVLRPLYGPEFVLFGSAAGAAVAAAAPSVPAGGVGQPPVSETQADSPAAASLPTSSFLDALLREKPEKRANVLDNMKRSVLRLVAKEMMMFRFVHALLLQYMTYAPASEARELAAQVGVRVSDLEHSTEGARVLMFALEQGAPKDRKAILKAMRDSVAHLATSLHGHMVLVRALDVVDDTVQLNKSVVEPLVEVLPGNLTSPQVCRVLLSVLAPRSQKYFHPTDVALLQPAFRRVAGEDGKEVREPTSRKDPETRRSEVLAELLGPVLDAVAGQAPELVRSPLAWRVVLEAVREGVTRGGKFEAAAAAALEAVARTAEQEEEGDDSDRGSKPLHKSFGGGDLDPKTKKTTKGKTSESDEDGGPVDIDEEADGDEASGKKNGATAAKKKNKKEEDTANAEDGRGSGGGGGGGNKKGEDNKEPWQHVMGHKTGHHTLKALLKALPAQSASVLASQLVRAATKAGEHRLAEHAGTTRGAFVMEALLEHLPAAERAQVVAAIRPAVLKMDRASTSFGVLAKAIGVDVEPKKSEPQPREGSGKRKSAGGADPDEQASENRKKAAKKVTKDAAPEPATSKAEKPLSRPTRQRKQ